MCKFCLKKYIFTFFLFSKVLGALRLTDTGIQYYKIMCLKYFDMKVIAYLYNKRIYLLLYMDTAINHIGSKFKKILEEAFARFWVPFVRHIRFAGKQVFTFTLHLEFTKSKLEMSADLTFHDPKSTL